ncbi:hypothetical protein BH18PSE1_BH18PSE1_12390 [soil metagenome]
MIDQVLRPVGRRHRVAEVALEVAACGHGVERHLRIPQDGTEYIVAIMGDPARERPDRLELLRLAELCLKPRLFGRGALALGKLLLQPGVRGPQLARALLDP